MRQFDYGESPDVANAAVGTLRRRTVPACVWQRTSAGLLCVWQWRDGQ